MDSYEYSSSSARTKRRDFADMTNAYDRGKYAGARGWAKLKYALQMRFDVQGMTGAVMSHTITHDMVIGDANNTADDDIRVQALKHLESLAREARRLTISVTPSLGVATLGRRGDSLPRKHRRTTQGATKTGREQDRNAAHDQQQAQRDGAAAPSQADVQHGSAERKEQQPHVPEQGPRTAGATSTTTPSSKTPVSGDGSPSSGPKTSSAAREAEEEDWEHFPGDGEAGGDADGGGDDFDAHFLDLSHEDDTQNRKERARNIMKVFEMEKALNELREKQRYKNQGYENDAKSFDNYVRTIRTASAFKKLPTKLRASLFEWCNGYIARVMALVLGERHRALLSIVNPADGIAIIEMLDVRADEKSEDPEGDALAAIADVNQDDDGLFRETVYFFERIERKAEHYVKLTNRLRRRGIQSGAIRTTDPNFELKQPHEFIPSLEGVFTVNGDSTILCTQAAAYKIQCVTEARYHQGLAERYQEIRYKISNRIAKARRRGVPLTVKEIKNMVTDWENLWSP